MLCCRGVFRGHALARTAGGGQAGHCRTARPFSRIQVARRAWPQPWSCLPCGGTILACRLMPGRSPQMPVHSGVTHLGTTRSVSGVVVHAGHELQNLHYWFCKCAISHSTSLVGVVGSSSAHHVPSSLIKPPFTCGRMKGAFM